MKSIDEKGAEVPAKRKTSDDPEVSLFMDCDDDALSMAQLNAIKKQSEELTRVTALLDKLHHTHNLVGKGQYVYGLTPKERNVPAAVKPILPNSGPVVSDVPRISQTVTQNPTQIQMPPIILQNSSGAVPHTPTTSAYQLVMDPRISLIVGAVSSTQSISGPSVAQGVTTMVKTPNLTNVTAQGSIMVQTPTIVVNAERGLRAPVVQRVVKLPGSGNAVPVLNPSLVSQIPIASPGIRTNSVVQVVQPDGVFNKFPPPQVVPSPQENRVAAPVGISPTPTPGTSVRDSSRPVSGTNSPVSVPAPSTDVGSPNVEVNHLSNNESSRTPNAEASRSADNLKSSGKLYPSLMVAVKPTLQSDEFTATVCAKMRAELDKELKKVLMLHSNQLTEWLIQQGLIRAEQKCHTHLNSNYQPVAFKLGIYSDSSKFPNSGGYVWVSDCCGQRHISVFSGSLFEGVPQTPKTMLKLMYHWVCQTSPSNVSQWVLVSLNAIKTFYSSMRAICITATHEKLKDLGGENKEVEVAIMTLGTSSNDGTVRQVKVEILGVLDPEKKIIRLIALDPPGKTFGSPTPGKRDYRQILSPITSWVDKRSRIITDLSVNHNCLVQLGYHNVKQITGMKPGESTLKVVKYLSTSVPRSFQNVLHMLNRSLIQQFLEEISWRESFGPSPLQAFKNLVIHLSEITKLDLDQTLTACLNRISMNPFQNWEYKNLCRNPLKAMVLSNIVPVGNVAPPPPAEEIEPPLSMIDRLPQSIRQVDPPPKRVRKRPVEPTDSSQSPVPVPEKRSRTTTVLQEYYYGRIKGRSKEDLEREEAEAKLYSAVDSVIEFQCCVCRRVFNNNISFMRHLIKHTQNKGTVDPSDDTPVCKYCLKTFVTPYILETHVKDAHIVKKGQLACRICNIEFFSTTKLIDHMHSTHVELELPYSCKVCGYRSSMHRDVVDHFHEFHDGSRKLQCPFCLQVVTLSGRGKLANHHVFLFFQHIQKHFIQPPSLKCEKCILKFATKGNVNEHISRDHNSCKGKPGLTRLQFKGESIVMAIPEVTPQPSTSSLVNKPVSENVPSSSSRASSANTAPNGKVKSGKSRTIYPEPVKVLPQEEIKIKKSTSNMPLMCYECKQDIYRERHFLTNLSCSQCRYSSCCASAVKAHMASYHSNKENPGVRKPADIKMEKSSICQMPAPMYCICGFRDTSGDALAKHLNQSECRTAYASLKGTRALETQSASFPPLVSLDDPEDQDPSDQMMKAYAERMAQSSVSSPAAGNSISAKSNGEPQSMLNILGLVRKPSTDDSSNDIPDVDDKGEFSVKDTKTTRSPGKGNRKKRK